MQNVNEKSSKHGERFQGKTSHITITYDYVFVQKNQKKLSENPAFGSR